MNKQRGQVQQGSAVRGNGMATDPRLVNQAS